MKKSLFFFMVLLTACQGPGVSDPSGVPEAGPDAGSRSCAETAL